jgi:hypothetical protein
MNGKGTPVRGIKDNIAKIFIKACAVIHVVIPTATRREKVSGAFFATA